MASSSSSATVVTGSSGFIGSHVMSRLAERPAANLIGIDIAPPTVPGYAPFELDIARPEQLAVLSTAFRGCNLIHLAARAAVQVDTLEAAAAMIQTNELGFINALRCLQPKRAILASSGAVYGNEPGYQYDGRPAGIYGCTKSSDEKLLRIWAKETGGMGYILRFGNVVGPNCRGLVPYLVKHAQQFPNGECAAQCRGEGLVERDYVPVEYVASVLGAALGTDHIPTVVYPLDLGSGFCLTNGDVGEIVKDELWRAGLKLNITWSEPLVMGETRRSALDPQRTDSHFPQVARPDRQAVEDALRRAVRSYL